jgi:predicted anti-sigma-YlaC factor YlaD
MLDNTQSTLQLHMEQLFHREEEFQELQQRQRHQQCRQKCWGIMCYFIILIGIGIFIYMIVTQPFLRNRA